MVEQPLDHQLLLRVVTAQSDNLVSSSSCGDDGVAGSDTGVSSGDARGSVGEHGCLKLVDLIEDKSVKVDVEPTLNKG